MALMPARTKHRKMQKGQHAGLSKAANFVDFGDFGMQASKEDGLQTIKLKRAV